MRRRRRAEDETSEKCQHRSIAITESEETGRTITLEEHFAGRTFLDGPGLQLKEQAAKFGSAATKMFEQLYDLGDARIAEMDAAGIDVQVLSLTSPGVEQLEVPEAGSLARESNDRLAEAVRSHPAR